MNQKTQEVKINIKATDELMAGKYANNVVVHMNKEEFVMDFVSFVPPHATLNARVISSPGNFKRMLIAMQESLNNYEKEFGQIQIQQVQTPPAEFVQ